MDNRCENCLLHSGVEKVLIAYEARLKSLEDAEIRRESNRFQTNLMLAGCILTGVIGIALQLVK